MYNISQAVYFSIESDRNYLNHLNHLEYLYTERYKDNIEPYHLRDILNQIKKLKRKLSRQRNMLK